MAILARAVERSPASPAPLAELAAALELLGRHREVVDALDASAALVATDPLLGYLRAFNAVMVADLDTARRLLPRLEAAADERFRFMAARIERMLARADGLRARSRLTLDDLRGWHYVLTGGVLLHATRIGRSWDTPGRVKAGVQSLALVLDALELAVPAVLYPPDRTSELLARVCAATLERPAQAWYGGDEPGLLVVYDARALIPELRAPLVHHRPGQPLFMQAAEHTTEQPTAPDVLTYLYQHNTSPWGPGLTAEHQPLDTTAIPIDELVRTALDAIPDPGLADRDPLQAFLADLRTLPPAAAPAALRADGQRERLWVGSPVATS